MIKTLIPFIGVYFLYKDLEDTTELKPCLTLKQFKIAAIMQFIYALGLSVLLCIT